MKKKLLLYGGGGHCKSVIDVIECTGVYEIEGIIDREENVGKLVLGHRIIGSDKDLPALLKNCPNIHISFGFIKNSENRRKAAEMLESLGAVFPVIISPRAHVSAHARIMPGTIVMHGAIVNAASEVGCHCILNTNSLIEHDSVVGNHCHISTSSTVNGTCTIGDDVFFGSGSVMGNNLLICSGTVIGSGSVVVKPIEEPGIYAGNPCRLIKNRG
ncbi:MAG: acetyltransferase, partial [Deferribacterales bacterium]